MKIDRLVSIIMILLDKKRVSALELSKTFEVSTRTIYRDIETINMAGIPVWSNPGVNGGFEIIEDYKLDKKVFSTSDLSAILMGLSNLSLVMNKNDYTNAITKIKSFIPKEKLDEIDFKMNQINIDLTPWNGNINLKNNLELIKKSLQESRLISFKYHDQNGSETSRVIETYQLVLKSNHWYLYGYCHLRNDYRLFKLSRAYDMTIKNEIFIPRDYKKPKLDFMDDFDLNHIKIKLRIHKSILDLILDYIPFDELVYDEEYYLVDFPFIENDYYYNVILGFGDKCECLEPLNVRNEIKKRINNMCNIYIK